MARLLKQSKTLESYLEYFKIDKKISMITAVVKELDGKATLFYQRPP